MDFPDLVLQCFDFLLGSSEQFSGQGLVVTQCAYRVLCGLALLCDGLGELSQLVIGVGEGLSNGVECLVLSLPDQDDSFGRLGMQLGDLVARLSGLGQCFFNAGFKFA